MQLYLSEYDHNTDFKEIRKVLRYSKQAIDKRPALVVDVDIPLIGQSYGYGGKDIKRFYLISRFDDNDIEKLNTFPIYVHVFISKNPDNQECISLSELSNIVWASLYDNEADARSHL